MFSEVIADLARGRLPDRVSLRRRFDMAMTKKMGVVRLPPAFWLEDPKINPRAEHLFWVSLLLLDRERMGLALAVLALEQAEQARSSFLVQESVTGRARELLQRLLSQIGDEQPREAFRCELRRTVPEWLAEDAAAAGSKGDEHGH